MKTTNFLLLSILSFTLAFNGCSSSKNVVSVSETHLYNNNYGLHSNVEVDSIIQNELMAMNNPAEVENTHSINPEWTTELKMDDDAFLAEDYVPIEPVISYKYKFDKKFYDKAEWRKSNF
jgi:hypothetical protein